jgi:hypothetical protein
METNMKNIPLNAPVYSSDQQCGHITYLVINPQTQRVTHLVVKEGAEPHVERMVPIEAAAKTSPDRIQLRCSRDEFKLMDRFVEIGHHEEMVPDYEQFKYTYKVWPYVPQQQIRMETRTKQVPLGELALHQRALVQATDGPVGWVAGLGIEPTSRRIKRLVIEQGVPWDRRQIAVPIGQIEQAEENVVYLKLDKHSLDALASNRTSQDLTRNWHVA